MGENMDVVRILRDAVDALSRLNVELPDATDFDNSPVLERFYAEYLAHFRGEVEELTRGDHECEFGVDLVSGYFVCHGDNMTVLATPRNMTVLLSVHGLRPPKWVVNYVALTSVYHRVVRPQVIEDVQGGNAASAVLRLFAFMRLARENGFSVLLRDGAVFVRYVGSGREIYEAAISDDTAYATLIGLGVTETAMHVVALLHYLRMSDRVEWAGRMIDELGKAVVANNVERRLVYSGGKVAIYLDGSVEVDGEEAMPGITQLIPEE